jgi:hypothetical protein
VSTYTDDWTIAAVPTNIRAILGSAVFQRDFLRLVEMISPDKNERLLAGATAWWRQALQSDPGSPCVAMPPGTLAPFLIAYLHLTLGTPLFISDALLDDWARSDGAQAECQRCGYRMPAPHRACIVCGGSIGEPGGWACSRTASAWLN